MLNTCLDSPLETRWSLLDVNHLEELSAIQGSREDVSVTESMEGS